MKITQSLPKRLIAAGFACAIAVLLGPILGIWIPREIAFVPVFITLLGAFLFLLFLLFPPKK